MIFIDAIATVRLQHRALHVSTADSGHVVALLEEGSGSLVGPDYRVLKQFQLSDPVKAVAISSGRDLVAVITEGALSIMHAGNLNVDARITGSFESCLFRHSLLWTASRLSKTTASIEVRAIGNWRVLARVEVEDPFEDSALMLFPQGNSDQIALWVAAGQDGQCLYWARRDGSSIGIQQFPGLHDTTPPSFDGEGSRFLVVSGCDLKLYRYPSGPELRKVAWQLEDDLPGECTAFIGPEHALIHSGNGRLFLVDLRTGQIADEVTIRGHELKPIREHYPNLRQDIGVCSDLSTFARLPNGDIMSVHRELPTELVSHWRDQLVFWRIPYSG